MERSRPGENQAATGRKSSSHQPIRPVFPLYAAIATYPPDRRQGLRNNRDFAKPRHVHLRHRYEAWLPDADGHRYTSELRIVAVDQRQYPVSRLY